MKKTIKRSTKMNVTFFRIYWRSLVVILTPIILLPLPVLISTAAARCGYVLLVMATYWVLEVVHLSATALIPIFAFPLLGVLSTDSVCLTYMKDTNVLFLGGLAMAAAIEDAGLHERIALFILRKIGSTPERLLFGFMMTQMFLSMWISNTAATAMMVPIVDAVLTKIREVEDNHSEPPTVNNEVNSLSRVVDLCMSDKDDANNGEIDARDALKYGEPSGGGQEKEGVKGHNDFADRLRDVVYLGIAYSANIGGTGSLTGTNPNLVLVGFLQLWYENKDTGINYATWLLFNVPGMIICTLLGYIWLCVLLLYYNSWKRHHNRSTDAAVQKILDARYASLGKSTFREKMVASLFAIAILLWLFRKPEVIRGWGPIVEDALGTKISAATPAMLIVFLMFVAPSLPFWSKGVNGNLPAGPSPGCLTWNVFHHKVPWGVIILIGSGFAIAEGGRESGLSSWLGRQFAPFVNLPHKATLIIVCFLTAMLTEIMSNTAASSLLLPVLNDMALAMRVNPLYFMLPVALCCSYAFMLPVATPPNAIVYEAAGNMPISRMMCAGVVMNIMCVLVAFLTTTTLGEYMFHFETFPEWANSSTSF